MRKAIGSLAGIGLVVLDSFEGGKILEFIGWASLPDEIREWGHGLMWSAHHFALWLPVATGLGIIIWANLGWVKMQIKDRRWRNAAFVALLVGSFFLSGLGGGAQTTQTTRPSPTAGNGNVAVGRDNNGAICTNGANRTFNAAPMTVPKTRHQKSSDVAPLSHLTDAQLQKRVQEYGVKMRDFELNVHLSQQPPRQYVRGTPEAEYIRQAAEDSKRSVESFENEKVQFSENYLIQARELKEELESRLKKKGILPPYFPSDDPMMAGAEGTLRYGYVGGPAPISDVANYLDALASKLRRDQQ